MDILISNLPYRVTEADVVRSVAAVVHSDGFPRRQVQVEVGEGDTIHRLINFKVQLNPSPAGGVGNNGMGVLTLPDIGAGNAFLRWVQNDGIKMDERKITFKKGRGRPSSSLVQTLDRTRYIPPEIEEERLRKRQQLHHRFHLDDVQSGVLFRPTYPTTDNQPLTQQEFSTEWTFDCVKKGGGCLEFEHDHRLIRIKLGDQTKDTTCISIAIKFSSILKIHVGHDFKPYVCFETVTPPLRIVLYDNSASDNFVAMCSSAGLATIVVDTTDISMKSEQLDLHSFPIKFLMFFEAITRTLECLG